MGAMHICKATSEMHGSGILVAQLVWAVLQRTQAICLLLAIQSSWRLHRGGDAQLSCGLTFVWE
jgi:hypothetical protein